MNRFSNNKVCLGLGPLFLIFSTKSRTPSTPEPGWPKVEQILKRRKKPLSTRTKEKRIDIPTAFNLNLPYRYSKIPKTFPSILPFQISNSTIRNLTIKSTLVNQKLKPPSIQRNMHLAYRIWHRKLWDRNEKSLAVLASLYSNNTMKQIWKFNEKQGKKGWRQRGLRSMEAEGKSRWPVPVSERGYDDASHDHRGTADFARERVRRGERSAVSLGSLNINLVSPLDDDPSRLFIIALSSVVTA